MKPIRRVVSALFLTFVLGGCGNTGATKTPTPTMLPTATQLRLPYLGQKTPGTEAEIFAPGIVSDPYFTEYSGAFSPDGNEYYFYRFSDNSQDKILFSKVLNGKWTVPEQLAVTAGYGASEPYVSFDNKYLYFLWDRPVPQVQSGIPVYFFAERTPNGWSEPKYAGQGMFLSSTREGQLYTTDMSSLFTNGSTYLTKIGIKDGLFLNYEKINIQTRLGRQAHPCIAPDGSYLLFDVEGGNYLFVSFKQSDGSWGEAIDLTKHGFDRMAGGAYVSPDGKYLFFGLRKDIWWVDIKVIEDLRPKG
jgi:hypothetical protein